MHRPSAVVSGTKLRAYRHGPAATATGAGAAAHLIVGLVPAGGEAVGPGGDRGPALLLQPVPPVEAPHLPRARDGDPAPGPPRRYRP
jgi:hypothetical protein